MQVLQSTTVALRKNNAAAATIAQQAVQMSANVDLLFQRLLLSPCAKDDVEVSRQEIRILILLFNKGEVTMSDLANALSAPLSTATRAVDRLVRKGLTERIRLEEDRRVVRVTLSAAGKLQGQQMLDGRQKMARTMLAALDQSERDTFMKLLGKVTRHATSQPKPAA